MNKWVIGVVILVIVLGGGYFAAKAIKHSMVPAPVTQTSTVQPTTGVSPTISATPSAMQQITVTGTEFAFTPSTITVKKGQEVQVTFKDMGKYPHNFTITDLGVRSATIQPGQTTTVTFTPDKAGSFIYICSVPGHADRGMTGTLTVE